MNYNSPPKLENSVFFAWTRISRRSEELSHYLGCDYVRFNRWDNNSFTLICSLIINFLRTTKWIIINQPSFIFTFNAHPFVTMSAKVGTWIIRKGVVIPDLHTAAYTDHYKGLTGRVAKWVWQKCPIILIHNTESKLFLSKEIPTLSEKLIVLEDAVPSFEVLHSSDNQQKPNCVLISRFASDEPIEEFLKAAIQINHCEFQITGNVKNSSFDVSKYKRSNLSFTGFLSDSDYVSLLQSADIITVLTTREMTLLSGGYEALALEKPIIISDTPTLRDYFLDDVLYVENSSTSLKSAIIQSLNEKEKLAVQVKKLKKKKQDEWEEKITTLISILID